MEISSGWKGAKRCNRKDRVCLPLHRRGVDVDWAGRLEAEYLWSCAKLFLEISEFEEDFLTGSERSAGSAFEFTGPCTEWSGLTQAFRARPASHMYVLCRCIECREETAREGLGMQWGYRIENAFPCVVNSPLC